MTYQYEYPHPAVTTDIVIFTLQDDELKALLIRRALPPFKDSWALPGGFIEIDEDLEACALRELEEETGVTGVYLEQLYTFGRPDRDPRERVITVAYYALVPFDRMNIRASSDATEVAWHACKRLPPLAFDHSRIIQLALERLAAKIDYSTIALQFMPERFTLGELQRVYEAILGEPQDKRNFRKRVMAYGCIEPTGETRRNGNHRPAQLFTAREPGRVEFVK
ncbi:MAG TPA: NUDIX domain-containing protein [Gammaproteobacteria bacterium]|jgi:8-oxo-dGTP diphosphatase